MQIIEKARDANTSEFIFKGEDHTLANMLCSELRRLRGVRHAGYRIPHPLSGEVIVYVQTDGSITPKQAVKIASDSIVSELTSLMEMVDKNVG